MGSGPRRIVCLSAETTDILDRLGAGDLVAGVSGYTTVPREARRRHAVRRSQSLLPIQTASYSPLFRSAGLSGSNWMNEKEPPPP